MIQYREFYGQKTLLYGDRIYKPFPRLRGRQINISTKAWALFLFYPSFTEATSCEAQEQFQNAVGALGAAVGEVPILSTIVNLANVYLE